MCETTHNNFKGRWRCTKNEKFDAYLGAHGINFFIRKIVNQGSCTVEIIDNEDGSWTVNEITAFRTATSTYKLGERYQAKHPVTEMMITAMVIMEDDKVVGKSFSSEESDDVVESTTRELLEDGSMLQVIYFKDVVCKRWFQKES